MKCSYCLRPLQKTDWRPLPGIDPRIRQWKCPLAHIILYSRAGEATLRKEAGEATPKK